jgi:hypothetical protein
MPANVFVLIVVNVHAHGRVTSLCVTHSESKKKAEIGNRRNVAANKQARKHTRDHITTCS